MVLVTNEAIKLELSRTFDEKGLENPAKTLLFNEFFDCIMTISELNRELFYSL